MSQLTSEVSAHRHQLVNGAVIIGLAGVAKSVAAQLRSCLPLVSCLLSSDVFLSLTWQSLSLKVQHDN